MWPQLHQQQEHQTQHEEHPERHVNFVIQKFHEYNHMCIQIHLQHQLWILITVYTMTMIPRLNIIMQINFWKKIMHIKNLVTPTTAITKAPIKRKHHQIMSSSSEFDFKWFWMNIKLIFINWWRFYNGDRKIDRYSFFLLCIFFQFILSNNLVQRYIHYAFFPILNLYIMNRYMIL